MTKFSIKSSAKSSLEKKAQRGFRGYPVATIAYYGTDDKIATKVAVGIVTREDGPPEFLERWFLTNTDVRFNEAINKQILEFIRDHSARSVVIIDRIIGCPHEEGIDYPEGKSCPKCPYWANKDRWTGKVAD